MVENNLIVNEIDKSKRGRRGLVRPALAIVCAAVIAGAGLQPARAQQETPPKPGAPRPAAIPRVAERTLPNGLRVATVARPGVPLVTVEVLVRTGAAAEARAKAGLADVTAEMVTKGTKTRTATDIAEQIEFLGGSIETAAGWNNSLVQITVTSDKLEQALAILSDVVLEPAFKQEELDLVKQQALDGLQNNLKQPGFVANYVASEYSFGEHPAGGTPAGIADLTTADVAAFKNKYYVPSNAVLIFTGDVAPARAAALATRFFGKWKNPPAEKTAYFRPAAETTPPEKARIFRRLLVVDLPDSGQASVNYAKRIAGRRADCAGGKCAASNIYYPASVLNSVLGGGYSSRLNQEIRIKRGLSYGAGSGFAWRRDQSNFSTRTQTKNESAAEVATLVVAELARLLNEPVGDAELNPRKLVLTGDFGRELETTGGLAGKIGELYTFGLAPAELDGFIKNVQATSAAGIKSFAADYLTGGDLIIVGDYKVFRADLEKRFPGVPVEVVAAPVFAAEENEKK